MEQYSGLDNQQENGVAVSESSHEINAARIAMFLDTDGFVTIQVRQRGIAGNAYLGPECGFVNTSSELMNWLHDTLTDLEVPHYMKWFDIDQLRGSRSRKPQCRIVVRGQNRCSKLLPIVQPYLVAKAFQGQLISEFITSRSAQSDKRNMYSDRELEIANTIRSLNNNKSGEWRPISSETVRRTMELRNRITRYPSKIQPDLHGDMQSVAEMTTPASV